MRDSGGAIITVGSIAGDSAFPLQGMYCASKHAVKAFIDAFRMELRAESAPISLTLIEPASIGTPLQRQAKNYLKEEPRLPGPHYAPEEVARQLLAKTEHNGRVSPASRFNSL
jgi:short-subunit dehydrogenase